MMRKYLEVRGITQADAARELGITQGRVSQLVVGGEGGVSLELAQKIYKWSDGAVNYLLPTGEAEVAA